MAGILTLFVKQLARIERQEARICRIRAKLSGERRLRREEVGTTPHEHHHIGVSQNYYEDIGAFLRKHSGDPAIQVQTLNLRSLAVLMPTSP